MKIIRVDEDVYRIILEQAGKLERKKHRRISFNEALRDILTGELETESVG